MKLKSDYNSGDAIFKAGVEIFIHSANDNYSTKLVDVNVALKSPSIDAVRGIGSLQYTDTWTDADVITFIKSKLDIE